MTVPSFSLTLILCPTLGIIPSLANSFVFITRIFAGSLLPKALSGGSSIKISFPNSALPALRSSSSKPL